MNKAIRNRRGFTLAELTMAVALLAFFSVFIVQMFAKADVLAKKARNLDQAVVCASNLADYWKTDIKENIPAEIIDLRQNRTAGKTAKISLDSHFQICDPARAVYLAVLSLQPVPAAGGANAKTIPGLWQLTLVLGRASSSDSGPLYTLYTSRYFAEEVAAQ